MQHMPPEVSRACALHTPSCCALLQSPGLMPATQSVCHGVAVIIGQWHLHRIWRPWPHSDCTRARPCMRLRNHTLAVGAHEHEVHPAWLPSGVVGWPARSLLSHYGPALRGQCCLSFLQPSKLVEHATKFLSAGAPLHPGCSSEPPPGLPDELQLQQVYRGPCGEADSRSLPGTSLLGSAMAGLAI